MAKYIVKRVAMGIFSVFIVATLTFFIMNLVPGGPFVAEKSISKAAQQALAEKYGVWDLKKFMGREYMGIVRTTFIIDEEGVLRHIMDDVKTKTHHDDVLSLVTAL